jgi:DNA-binding MarR family transcriptional regulator
MNQAGNDDIKKLTETFERFAKADWSKQTRWGIKPSEVRVLLCIKKLSHESQHEVNVSQISKMLSVTSPTVTQMIKSLNNNELIEQSVDSKDRRIANIKLTEKGETIAIKATERKRSIISGLIESLGKEKSETLNTLLNEAYIYFEEASKKQFD